MEALTNRDKALLLTLVHDAMDQAGKVNDDERLKELAHTARRLGDGDEQTSG